VPKWDQQSDANEEISAKDGQTASAIDYFMTGIDIFAVTEFESISPCFLKKISIVAVMLAAESAWPAHDWLGMTRITNVLMVLK
jgi:hypothetical protein